MYKGLSPLSLLETYGEEQVPVIQKMLECTTELLDHAAVAKADKDDATTGKHTVVLDICTNSGLTTVGVPL